MTPIQISKKLALTALLIISILLLIEGLFRLGIWEFFVKPESNAGQSIRLKNAVNALGADKLEFVTLGDSRTVYGIDHQRVADAANAAGYSHMNLSLAGSHWLTINSIMDWVTGRGANLKGAMIGMSNTSFVYAGNGYYELGVAAPFLNGWDSDRLKVAVPFDKKEMPTYGVYSATFQYREDIQNLLKEPWRRVKEKRVYQNQGAAPLTFSVKHEDNVCTVPMQTIQSCASANPKGQADSVVIQHCKNELVQAENQLDWRNWQKPGAVPHLAAVAKLRQDELRNMKVKKPILFLLMPEVKLRRDELNPKGIDEFVKATLKPLVDDGTIVLHDYSRFFDEAPKGECHAFWDLLHQNTAGQQQLTDAVLPVIKATLY
jgi:hypothetical protein